MGFDWRERHRLVLEWRCDALDFVPMVLLEEVVSEVDLLLDLQFCFKVESLSQGQVVLKDVFIFSLALLGFVDAEPSFELFLFEFLVFSEVNFTQDVFHLFLITKS